MKLSEMKDLTASDSVSRKGDVITFRRGFFYTHGQTSEGFAKRVALALPGAVILDHGQHWAPFNGGASVARSSHWWVKVRLEVA